MGELAAVRAELERAREESNRVTLENERLIDERDTMEQRIQSAAEARLTEMEMKFESTVAQVRARAKDQVEEVRIELEQLRRAASGDPCGWEECEDGTFVNSETGEKGIAEIPETLAFARAVRRVDDLGMQEETAKKAQKRAQIAETKRRELDVRLNEARADANAQRELLTNWTVSARIVASSVASCSSSIDAACGIMLSQSERVSKQSDSLGRSALRIRRSILSIKTLREALSAAEARNNQLNSKVSELDKTLDKAQKELANLRGSLASAVEAEVKPMRAEVSKARDTLSRERLARVVERRQLAALWPPDHLAPVALRRHMIMDTDVRNQLLCSALTAAADSEIKREIRRRVAAASRWSQTTDDYGRKYFVHADTGEAAWDPPPTMLYEPPPGRDELGNVVDALGSYEANAAIPSGQILTDTGAKDNLSKASQLLHTSSNVEEMRSGAWVETMDEWGQASWRNTLTGEVSWLQPKAQSAAASGSSVRVDDLPVLADRDQIAVTGNLTVGEEAQPRGNIALLPDEENFSSSCDEDLPTSGDSFSFFSQRQERRVAQLDRRRNKAIIAARKALTFLEEQVHSGFEDDTPVFVDVQALRALAAGDNNWKYVSRKERKAARIRTEALRIANEKETRALEEARRAEVRRTLAQRRRASGLQISSNQNEATPITGDSTDTYIQEVVKNEQLQDQTKAQSKPGFVADAFRALEGKSSSTCNLPLEQLRKELEIAARSEDDLLTRLACTRRRVGEISYRLLRSLKPSQAAHSSSNSNQACLDSDKKITDGREHVAHDFVAKDHLVSLRLSLLQRAGNFAGAGNEQNLQSSTETFIEGERARLDVACFIHVLAAEAVLSGLRGITWRCQPGRMHTLASPFENGELNWSSVAVFVDARSSSRPFQSTCNNNNSQDDELSPMPSSSLATCAEQAHGVTDVALVSHKRMENIQESTNGKGISCICSSRGESSAHADVAQKDLVSVRCAAQFAVEIARILDLGSKNHLPQQLVYLADIPGETTNRSTLNDGFSFFEAMSTRPKMKVTQIKPDFQVQDRCNAVEVITEVVLAHNEVLSALLTQSAQLGAEAWTHHETRQIETELNAARLHKMKTQHDHALEDAVRRTQSALNRYNQSLRISRNEGENQALKIYEKCLADGAREMTRRDCTIEAWQHEKLEADAERERGCWLSLGAQHAVSMRAMQVVERARQARELVRLQHALRKAFAEHRQADLNCQAHESISLTNMMHMAELSIVRLREQFREIGRQRKLLHAEELLCFQIEIRRLLGDKENSLERRALLIAIANARAECDHAILGQDAARVIVAAAIENNAHHNFIDNCNTLVKSSETRVAAAYAQLALLENSRRIARKREQRQRIESISASVRSHRGYGLHSARALSHTEPVDCNRHHVSPSDEMVRLRHDPLPLSGRVASTFSRVEIQQRQSNAISRIESTANARLHVHRRGCYAIAELHHQLLNERASRRRIQNAALNAGIQATEAAKQLAKTAQASATSERLLSRRDALREARERDVAETKFRDGLTSCKCKIELHEALSEALRHSLGVEEARRRVRDLAILKMTKLLAELRARSRDEIYYERAHSARLELWVHTMLASFSRARTALVHREALLDQQKTLDMQAQRALRLDVWRQTTAAHTLGIDVSSLFLFFAQRLATMSGAHRTFNNALRANGAALVLAAMCRSPRRELRRLAAKALASLAWNGHADCRSFGADIREQWRLWVDVAVSRAKACIQLAQSGRELEAVVTNTHSAATSHGDPLVGRVDDVVSHAENPRDVAVARRQWALRRRRTSEGPNYANIQHLVRTSAAWLLMPDESPIGEKPSKTVSPIIKTLLVFSHDRDYDCVLAAACGLAGVSFDAKNAGVLGQVDGLIITLVGLVRHANPEVVALACDAAANLAFQQQRNQEAFGAAGLVQDLVEILRSSSMFLPGDSRASNSDIIEAAACALANLLPLHSPNVEKLIEVGGLEVLFQILSSSHSIDLLDADQATLIQANAANALANTFALVGTNHIEIVHGVENATLSASPHHTCLHVLLPRSFARRLVMLCAAPLSTARRAASLLLGNLACNSHLRNELGHLGAVEALWSVSSEHQNSAERATALWALSNLVWCNSANQDRCGQFLLGLLTNCAISCQTISTRLGQNACSLLECAFAVCLVANAVYFHDSNRILVETATGALKNLVSLSGADKPLAVREPALRCLSSLTATDRGAKRVAFAGDKASACASLVNAAGDSSLGSESARIRRLGAAALVNMCSLVDSHEHVYLAGGVDALVALAGANDAYARHEAQMALAALEENMTSEKESTMCDQQLAHADLVSLLRAVASATPVSPRRS